MNYKTLYYPTKSQPEKSPFEDRQQWQKNYSVNDILAEIENS
jgi:hypothetical protein